MAKVQPVDDEVDVENPWGAEHIEPDADSKPWKGNIKLFYALVHGLSCSAHASKLFCFLKWATGSHELPDRF